MTEKTTAEAIHIIGQFKEEERLLNRTKRRLKIDDLIRQVRTALESLGDDEQVEHYEGYVATLPPAGTEDFLPMDEPVSDAAIVAAFRNGVLVLDTTALAGLDKQDARWLAEIRAHIRERSRTRRLSVRPE